MGPNVRTFLNELAKRDPVDLATMGFAEWRQLTLKYFRALHLDVSMERETKGANP